MAWNVGQRYHYIGSAEDQQMRIYKLNRVMTTVPAMHLRSSSNDDMGNAKSESHDDQLSLMSSNGPYQCLAVSVERDGLQPRRAMVAWCNCGRPATMGNSSAFRRFKAI
jgi:hypothetical protein